MLQTGIANEDIDTTNKQANLYRTKWLMAHNALHALTHDEKGNARSIDNEKSFQEYLIKLEHAPEIAEQTA